MVDKSPYPFYKVLTVGDGACGKTSMLLTYTKGEFPDLYVPTVFENYPHNVKLQSGKMLTLDLWDTAGQEDYDRLRPIAYTDVAVVLLAFSVDMPVSLENVYDKWWPEVMHYCPFGTPMILVGLKTDLRRDGNVIKTLRSQGLAPVTAGMAQSMANKIGHVPYVECSSKTGEGLHIVFQTVVDAIRKPSIGRTKGKCTIL
ncbi:P-loop containing nucleoside triphosphate hydrolase protein [Lipomyces doorenjongii]|uniref:P-loop containing nucleoside triphosphate hydrolase protein n=1 Tax=Lipomyces doorenjongii TaxID=383834 RepID=UPI0033436E89